MDNQNLDQEDGASSEEKLQQPNKSEMTDHVCTSIGYGCTLAITPVLLLSRIAKNGDLEALCSFLPDALQPIHGVIPSTYCLLFCVFSGLVLALLSDKFTEKRHFTIVLGAAFACLLLSICIPSDLIGLPLVGFSCASAQFLWRLHVINKVVSPRSVFNATAVTAGALLFAAVLDLNNNPHMLRIVLTLSLTLFFAISDSTFEKWLYIPREAMLNHSFNWARRIKPAVTHFAGGIAFGVMLYALGHILSQAAASVIWLISVVLIYACNNAENKRSKQARLAHRLMLFAVCLLLIPLLPEHTQWVAASLLLIAAVTSSALNVARHYVINKDSDLSDTFLSGYRVTTDNIANMIGFASSYAVLALAGSPSVAMFALCSLVTVLFIFSTLLSMGAFSERRDKKAPAAAKDIWHEKVVAVAKAYDLTPRQAEIFEALSRGRNAKYIAQRLYLSEGAVKKSLFLIYKKLDVHNQQDLITLVMQSEPEIESPVSGDESS